MFADVGLSQCIQSIDAGSTAVPPENTIQYHGRPIPPTYAAKIVDAARALQELQNLPAPEVWGPNHHRVEVADLLQIDSLWSPEHLLGQSMDALRQCAAMNACREYSKLSKADLTTMLTRKHSQSLSERGVNHEAVVKKRKLRILAVTLDTV